MAVAQTWLQRAEVLTLFCSCSKFSHCLERAWYGRKANRGSIWYLLVRNGLREPAGVKETPQGSTPAGGARVKRTAGPRVTLCLPPVRSWAGNSLTKERTSLTYVTSSEDNYLRCALPQAAPYSLQPILSAHPFPPTCFEETGYLGSSGSLALSLCASLCSVLLGHTYPSLLAVNFSCNKSSPVSA